ncbi:MAG: gliding motility lipoprotein GldB [Mucilaginibacter sp.]
MIVLNPKKPFYLFVLFVAVISACKSNKKVDVSNIQLEAKIERFDQEFDAMRTKPMGAQAAYLQRKYGAFYNNFLSTILQEPRINTQDTSYFEPLRKVFANQAYKDLKNDIDSVFKDGLDKQNDELTDAFKRIKYYFPKKQLPRVYSYYSGFWLQTAVGDDYVGIGLDLFLGANSRFYPALTNAYPHYVSQFFNKENIVPRIVEGIAREDMFPESDSSKTLLSKMVYGGKIMYFMDQVLPDVGDSTKIGYTTAQIKWCEQFKDKIWAYILDENLLYETDYPKIQKYLNPAPFTPGLGEKNESAPKLGIWTGWQIVRQYMDKHPEVTLSALMANNDAQMILNESKYKGK